MISCRPNRQVPTTPTEASWQNHNEKLSTETEQAHMNEKIDLLRRANFMRIDKKSETVAVQHCCSIHYHRCLVLEGARRVALRNIGNSDKTESNPIIDDGTANLLSRRYNAPVEVIVEDLNRICRDMFGIFINSHWEVYLCLLHEELHAYRRLVSKKSEFKHPPLTEFLDRNRIY